MKAMVQGRSTSKKKKAGELVPAPGAPDKAQLLSDLRGLIGAGHERFGREPFLVLEVGEPPAGGPGTVAGRFPNRAMVAALSQP